METLPPLQRGDLIEVTWVDIYENSVGNPDDAILAKRVSFGLYWDQPISRGVQSLVTTTTLEDDHSQSGFCIYPLACIVNLKIIKKVKSKRGSNLQRTV